VTIRIRSNPSGRITLRGVAQCHEYAIFAAKSAEGSMSKLPRSEEQAARFDQTDTEGAFEWRNFRRDGSSSTRSDRPKQFFPLFVEGVCVRIPAVRWRPATAEYELLESPRDGEAILWPVDSRGDERCWRWGIETAREKLNQLAAKTNPQGLLQVYNKYRPNMEGVLPLTVWTDKQYSSTEYGTAIVKDIFGLRSPFDFPKSLFATRDCIHISSIGTHGTVLDCFAGSGTTAHAVLTLNREDNGSRKYLLVEMGAHFDTVLVPRLKKVVYSKDWRGGKPTARNTGVSQAFKTVRLESYEDTLNNLRIQRTTEGEAVERSADPAEQDEYMLGYFLNLESEGSPSLLDVSRFKDPFSYKLNIATRTAGETKPTNVDLVETFNWLLGLKVKHIDHQKGFVTVTGEKRSGGRVLIVWRTLGNDALEDNRELESFLKKIQVNPAETEYDFIYINGSHTLADPHNKIHLTEEEFQRLMFEGESLESIQ
jgi:adenine-specific DNA-methyltransferase